MRTPIMPHVVIEGDSKDQIMARSGEIVGWSDVNAVWRFGFLPDSDSAHAYHVSVPEFLWIIADWHGEVKAVFEGFAYNLPTAFNKIIEFDDPDEPAIYDEIVEFPD